MKTPKPTGIRTRYLNTVFRPDNLPLVLEATTKAVKSLKRKHRFDTIAFCGVSGAAIAFLLSYRTKLPLLCVRKSNDKSHYAIDNRTVLEGNFDVNR